MQQDQIQNYGWQTDDGPHSCNYIVPEILNLLKRLGSQRVLDLGSGNGALCAAIKAQRLEVVGVERDADGVAIASQRNPDIRFYNLGVEDDPQPIVQDQECFDMVVSTEVIEHLYSPHLLPQFAAPLLQAGGYLLLTTPYHGYLKNLALSIFDKWDDHLTPLWHGGHIKFWSRKTISQLLQSNGFEVVEFGGVGRVPYLWKSMVVLARKQ